MVKPNMRKPFSLVFFFSFPSIFRVPNGAIVFVLDTRQGKISIQNELRNYKTVKDQDY